MKHTGPSVVDVLTVASYNPARAIGMEKEIGSIEVGKRADIIITDNSFNVKHTFVNGVKV